MSSTSTTRVAIITGAAQGIGRAIALRLAEDGLDIAINDIPSKTNALEEVVSEIRQKGRKAIYVTGDVSQEADVQKLVDETVAQLGSVDVMVANAGIGKGAQLLDTSVGLDAWQNVWDINAKGVFLSYQLAARQMVKQGRGGRLLGASSICGKKGYQNLGAYSSTKFAVRGLTQTAATELAEHKITVNAYAPGLIDTAMTNVPGRGLDPLRKTMNIPNAPSGQPEDVANLVSYLASPEAYFISGQTLVVGGDVILT